MEAKKEIRARALKERAALLPEARASFDQKIRELAAAHPFFQNAREIYCYASFRDEVSTAGLMELAWKAGKKVAVPCVTDSLQMEFYYIESLEELRPGYQGILEPEIGLSKKAIPVEVSKLQGAPGQGVTHSVSRRVGGFADRRGLHEKSNSDILMILPGAAFDRMGNRIGYGKGFYDRYLRRFPCCCRMGLAYSAQCVDAIPAESWDIRVETVITEKGNFMSCGMNCQKTL